MLVDKLIELVKLVYRLNQRPSDSVTQYLLKLLKVIFYRQLFQVKDHNSLLEKYKKKFKLLFEMQYYILSNVPHYFRLLISRFKINK